MVTQLPIPSVVAGRDNHNPAGDACIAPYIASDGLTYWRVHSEYTEHNVYIDTDDSIHEGYASAERAWEAYDACFPSVFQPRAQQARRQHRR